MAKTEARRTGDFILSEASGTRSRDEVTIAAAAAALEVGTVMGKITASGKYVAYDNGASDGSEVAAGVLYAAVADSAADQKGVIIARDAEVNASRLTGSDTAGVADLKALGVIAR
ncbi:MAG: head decoration protein [Acidobacteria bacterium]|nr:head decoration protein [Acidobacteriota bacterium]